MLVARGLLALSPLGMIHLAHRVAEDQDTSVEAIGMVGAVASFATLVPTTRSLRDGWLFGSAVDAVSDGLLSYGATVAAALAVAQEPEP